MPGDILGSPSAQFGPSLEQNGAYPLSQPVNSGADFALDLGAGDVCLHQGVPHIVWSEVQSFAESPDGFAHWFGPYVARKNGASWDLVAPPALPEGIDQIGVVCDWPPADLATTCPAVDRGNARIKSDGENLFLGVVAAVNSRQRTSPDGSPFTSYHCYAKWLVYGFVLVGSSWVSLGDPVYGMFPTIGLDGHYDTTVMFWDFGVDVSNPGSSIFAMSDYGESVDSIQVRNHWHLAVTGTGVPETMLETDSAYILQADGAGATAAVYYQADPGELPFRNDSGHVTVWTPTGTGTIPAAALETGFPTTIKAPTVVATFAGVRYAVFPVTVDTGFGPFGRQLIQKIDPAAPFVLQHLFPAPFHTYNDPLNLDDLPIRADVYAARTIIVEERGIWVGFLSLGSGGFADHLDLVCSTRTGWTSQAIPASSFEEGRFVVYQDALWWYSSLSAAITRDASVFETPICRGCVPCENKGFHFWRRANLGRGARGAN